VAQVAKGLLAEGLPSKCDALNSISRPAKKKKKKKTKTLKQKTVPA
jgi:hypothetical protein